MTATAAAPAETMLVMPGKSTPCQRRLDEKRAWGPTLAVQAGSVVMGVRADSLGSAEILDAVLAPMRASEFDREVSPNFSVEIGRDDRSRKLFLAYQAHQVVARRYDRDQLLVDLVELLDGMARAESSDALAVHAGVALLPSGEAMLLPVDVHRTLLPRRRQLEGAGLQLLASRIQQYDASAGELVTGAVDVGAALALESLGVSGATPRIPVRVWTVGARSAPPQELRGATALVAALGMVVNREQIGMGQTLRAAREAVQRHRVVAMPTLTAGAQAAAVLDLLS